MYMTWSAAKHGDILTSIGGTVNKHGARGEKLEDLLTRKCIAL